jgi:CHAT domain-containing protein
MVLSACQTGLGYITADGVYGIQRALKQAGVDAMVVSLWSVSDEASALLMSRFYRNLCNGMDTYAAFMDARSQLMTAEQNSFDAGTLSHRRTRRFADPQYTDAFILIDVL